MRFLQNTVQKQKMARIQGATGMEAQRVLAMSNDELCDYVQNAVEQNPNLRPSVKQYASGVIDRYSTYHLRSVSTSQNIASDKHLEALENVIDSRLSLKEHFLSQLAFLHLSHERSEFAKKLIYSLDNKGHFTVSVQSLLPKNAKTIKTLQIDDLICSLQRLDPIGCFVNSTEHSLFVQALNKSKPCPSIITLCILNGNLSWLYDMDVKTITMRVNTYLKKMTKSNFGVQKKHIRALVFPQPFEALGVCTFNATESQVDEALDFIKRLDPNPTHDFTLDMTAFINIDARVRRIPYSQIQGAYFVRSKAFPDMCYSIELTNTDIYDIELQDLSYDKSSFLQAKIITNALQYRKKILYRALCKIVEMQCAFFDRNGTYLEPFTQTQLAQILQISQSAVCRLVNSKFIECDFGILPLKFFFSPKIADNISQSYVMYLLKSMIHKNNTKVTDTILKKELEQCNIFISRRTINKYRSLLFL